MTSHVVEQFTYPPPYHGVKNDIHIAWATPTDSSERIGILKGEYWRSKQIVYLATLKVDFAFRHHHIATHLLDDLETWAKSKRATSIRGVVLRSLLEDETMENFLAYFAFCGYKIKSPQFMKDLIYP